MKLLTIYDVRKDQSFLVEVVSGEETLDALRAAVQERGSEILLPLSFDTKWAFHPVALDWHLEIMFSSPEDFRPSASEVPFDISTWSLMKREFHDLSKSTLRCSTMYPSLTEGNWEPEIRQDKTHQDKAALLFYHARRIEGQVVEEFAAEITHHRTAERGTTTFERSLLFDVLRDCK